MAIRLHSCIINGFPLIEDASLRIGFPKRGCRFEGLNLTTFSFALFFQNMLLMNATLLLNGSFLCSLIEWPQNIYTSHAYYTRVCAARSSRCYRRQFIDRHTPHFSSSHKKTSSLFNGALSSSLGRRVLSIMIFGRVNIGDIMGGVFVRRKKSNNFTSP